MSKKSTRVRKVTEAILGEIDWEGLGEISGFGGAYEAACRKMVEQGVAWIRANGHHTAEFRELKNIFGYIEGNNPAGQQFIEAVTAGIDGPTGAMVQAAVKHVHYIAQKGTKAYEKAMREKSDD